mgnify:CR=1 FL=1
MFSFCIPIQFVFGSGSFKKLSVPLAGKESFNRHYQRRLCKKIGIFRGNGETVGKIGKGFLVLIGVGRGDTREDADWYLKKLLGLRIFEDENGKTNLSLADVNGELLLISQFTLYADCKKGNRPNFTQAAKPDIANALYEFFVDYCKNLVPVVETGIFGADMQVSLENDGPFTVIFDENLRG